METEGPSTKRRKVLDFDDNDLEIDEEIFRGVDLGDGRRIIFNNDDGDVVNEYDDVFEVSEDVKSNIEVQLDIVKCESDSFTPLATVTSSGDDSSTCDTNGEVKKVPYLKKRQLLIKAGSKPIDFFTQFFDDEFLLMITAQTNMYADRLYSTTAIKESSRMDSWVELTVSELKIFLGLLFHTGTIQLSQIDDYWNTNRLFNIPIFNQQMSKSRFLMILRCLYFSCNKTEEGSLGKIKSVIDYFNNKMNAVYCPGKELCIDEHLMLQQGQIKLNKFVEHKHDKHIRLYSLIEPDGIILRLYACTGSKFNELAHKSNTNAIVMGLLEGKLGSGHSVYLHSNYTSYSLAKTLLDKDTYCTGILKPDSKDIPAQILDRFLRQGVIIGISNEQPPVPYITTEFEVETTIDGTGVTKYKPIYKYNRTKNMGGCDVQEQLFSFYPCEKTGFWWYKKLAIHVFQVLMINSYKLYNKYSGSPKMTFYDYRTSVIESLLPAKEELFKINPNPSSLQSAIPITLTHKISKITEKNNSNRAKRKICRQCTRNNKRKDSIYHCTFCPGNPGLCFDCFEPYHEYLSKIGV